MAWVGSETIETAALGRPFQLGMLYDCRNDALIPGVTLWDHEELQKNTNKRPQSRTDFSVSASDSIEDKALSLKVNASLKASLLGGLVEVEGAARYFNDKKKSASQARVTLQYHTTTRFEALTMSHLGRGKVSHPCVFEDNSATHVVTAVLYGAQAYFLFDREVSTEESKQDIKGELNITVAKLKNFTIGAKGSVGLSETDKKSIEKFSCTFYGDFQLQANPSTFTEAVTVYRSLPSLLGAEGERAVPIRVWLYPLSKLDSRAARLVRNISNRFLKESQTAIEELDKTEMQCNDLLKHTVSQTFPEVHLKIDNLKQMTHQYKLHFTDRLASLLPAVRGGGKEEDELREEIKQYQESPFSFQRLSFWLNNKEREMDAIFRFIRKLKSPGIKILSSEAEREEVLFDIDVDTVVCFTFTSLHQPEPFLSELASCLKHPESRSTDTYTQQASAEWMSQESLHKMRESLTLFLELERLNKDKDKMKFYVDSKRDEQRPAACIVLYDSGCSEGMYFEPPSRPDSPGVTAVTPSTVTVQLPPSDRATEKRRVEYKRQEQQEWISHPATGTGDTLTLTGLQTDTVYELRSTAVGKLGYTESSDITTVKTPRATSPPKSPSAPQASPTSIKITWERPSVVGEGVSIQGYIIEYREEKEHRSVQWVQKKTGKEQYSFTVGGLTMNTAYKVRVRCDCGELGTSAPSEEVPVRTQGKKTLERIQRNPENYTLIEEGKPSLYRLNLMHSKEGFCCKRSFGSPGLNEKNRTIMVLGATGSGKSTLINGMVNYILGVEWEDECRFKLVHEDTGKTQAESQTSEITAYQIYSSEGLKVPHSLTIIDTPGFGDTRGIKQDKLITEKIRQYFSDPDGIVSLDAVCFMVQSALARLTHTQKYIFDSILSIFGKDIAENIVVLVTFADGKKPPVLEAIKAADISCAKEPNGTPVHFKFNNSILFSPNERLKESSTDNDFDKMFWEMGTSSMRDFFYHLSSMTTQSLQLTKAVLTERKQLEVCVEGLQPLITIELTKLDEINKIKESIKHHQDCIEANKDFEIVVEITVPKKVSIKGTKTFVTHCFQCNFTCHYPCQFPKDGDKKGCAAMNSLTGDCKVCVGKCNWSVHGNVDYHIEYETQKTKKTYDILKAQYEKAQAEKLSDEGFYQCLEKEYDQVQEDVLELTQKLSASLTRLKEIALRPNPLSTPGYIDLLIEAEEQEAKPGFQERIRELRSVKEKAEIEDRFSRGEYASRRTEVDPKDQHKSVQE
ncbi:uncharacterized protein LOC136753991 [Amia ocellicauda]|uniref:uncharacterized protein LOC136753991 n=1 Tax=Amia ocellicauda TaxID=2972642 RepID=UPI003463CE3C